MANIHIPKTWEISEREVTPEAAFINRRRFLRTLAGAGLSIAGGSMLGYATESEAAKMPPQIDPNLMKFESVERNPAFTKVDRPITDRDVAAKYNNFYEFGGSKSIWEAAQALPTENWKVEVTGLVRNPRTYDLDDLKKKFPLEERVYRFRCVEAWAMVVPWLGFTMKHIIDDVEPTSEARYVRFISYYNRQINKGPGRNTSRPWPYTEGLRTDEMANDLAFFAIGIYGHELPKQHGAPIRQVIPWKYGFKGAKSIVKIEFLNYQPKTFWNELQPHEYGFEANVEPDVPHPRWSQASERMIGSGPAFMWKRRDTLLYNGYAEQVAHLYDR